MATGKDWMTEAAETIGGASENNRDVIAELCPFKEGVLYMPVPRCDQCRFWQGQYESQGHQWAHCDAAQFTPDRPLMFWPVSANDGDVVTTREDFGCVQWERKA